MKTNLKIFAAVGIMLGFVMGANAQSAVTHGVTANASVQTKLLVSQVQPLEFGTVDNVDAQTKTVSVDGTATSSGSAPGQTGVQAGIGQIVRTGDAMITYKLVSPITNLAGPSGSLLPIKDFVTSWSFTQGGAKTSGNATVANDTPVSGVGANIFVYIGATVTPDATTNSIGLHTASITLSAEYNWEFQPF